MKVTIKSYTHDPVNVCSEAAGTSYGRDNTSYKRLSTCVKNGHMSVLEHAVVTFKVEGISRACSHQLVRHRIASYVQKSQRYTKVDDSDFYVVPPEVIDDAFTLKVFCEAMDDCRYAYKALLDSGVKPEDARFVLPEATKTDLTVTMNYRSFFNFLNLRLDKAAQWEIRDLAAAMYTACRECEDAQVSIMMDLYDAYVRGNSNV